MGQLDPSSAQRAADPSPAEPLDRSLEDRLLFRRAQALLVGLTDCGYVNAARSLRTTAIEQDVDVAVLAERFLDCLAEPRTEPAQSLLLRIAGLALLPDGAAGGRGHGARDLSPRDGLGVGGGRAERVVGTSVTPVPGGLSVWGVLDAAAAPFLRARARPGSVARAIRSSHGTGFHLDLTALTHLDGAGLRALDALATSVRDGGSTLRVTAPRSPGLGRLLDFAVSLRWLPAAFEATSSASVRPHGGHTGSRPAGPPSAPSHAECLAELEALYDCYAGASWSLARRLLGEDRGAEAVVEIAFLDAWQQLTSATPFAGPAGASLLHRTHSEAVHRLRAGHTRPRPSSGAAQDDDAPARPHALRLPSSPPRAGPSSLPEHQARALQLALWSGLTLQQIAITTGAPLADVRAHLLAGIRTLSSTLDHPPQGGDALGRGAARTGREPPNRSD